MGRDFRVRERKQRVFNHKALSHRGQTAKSARRAKCYRVMCGCLAGIVKQLLPRTENFGGRTNVRRMLHFGRG